MVVKCIASQQSCLIMSQNCPLQHKMVRHVAPRCRTSSIPQDALDQEIKNSHLSYPNSVSHLFILLCRPSSGFGLWKEFESFVMRTHIDHFQHTHSLSTWKPKCVWTSRMLAACPDTDLSQLNKYVARPSCHVKAVMLTPPCSELVVKGEAENSRAAWPLLL